jgi:methylthioribulose-1-phosphate dehydratase
VASAQSVAADTNGEKTGRDGAAQVAIQAVVAAGQMAGARGWTPATAGNFSSRVDTRRIAITRSGADKGNLSPSDVIVLPLDDWKQPGISAEAPLHIALYKDSTAVRAVWHAHGPWSVIASRLYEEDGEIRLNGWELQKVLKGFTTHEDTVVIPVLPNDQDTERLADAVAERMAQPLSGGAKYAPGYLIAGHGLYAWGGSPQEAWRHMEGIETLLMHELEFNSRRR